MSTPLRSSIALLPLVLALAVFGSEARADPPPRSGHEATAKRRPKRAPARPPKESPAPARLEAPASLSAPPASPVADSPAPTPTSTTTTTSAPLPASAPELPPAAPRASSSPSHHLRPLQLDLRATANTDILLVHIGVGATADLGLVPAGPGTIAIGAGFEYNFCGSFCWAFNALTPFNYSQHQITPSVRASYHLDLKKKNLDVYPLLFAGPVFARSSIELDDGSASYVGKDTGFQVGVGAGLAYFVSDRFSVGLEARYRHARGTYEYELRTGNDRTYDRGNAGTWSLSGLNVMFAFGVRL